MAEEKTSHEVRSLLDLVRRNPAAPWRDGDNIPWQDPAFSRQMLKAHMSQVHDRASRRFVTIDAHVAWIHGTLLGGRPSRILDLGCGPGLYTSRFAALGHECVGIDYSPASIGHATEFAEGEEIACRYIEGDLRTTDFGEAYDLALLISGELNVFRPADAEAILRKAQASLEPSGILVLEPHHEAAVRAIRDEPFRWFGLEKGLFSDRPHLLLQEYSWNDDEDVATIRYFVVDAETSGVSRYAQSYQAYSEEAYADLFARCGFSDVETHESLAGPGGEVDDELVVYVMRESAEQ